MRYCPTNKPISSKESKNLLFKFTIPSGDSLIESNKIYNFCSTINTESYLSLDDSIYHQILFANNSYLEKSKKILEKTGKYFVIGGYLVPDSDKYIKSKKIDIKNKFQIFKILHLKK